MSTFGLKSDSTLSDNITRIRMQGGRLSAPDVLNELIEVTRKDGFSRRELADARAIRATLARLGDADAGALDGLVEAIIEARDADNLFDRLRGLKEAFRENELPSLAWQEEPTGDVKPLVDRIRELQGVFAPRSATKTPGRVFHRKQILGRMGKLVVRSGLPSYAKIAPFDQPGEFAAAVRFSNGQGLPFADRAPDVRGLAVKFFAGDGREASILATNAPASFARNADQFVKVGDVLVTQQLQGPRAAGEVLLHNLLAGRFNPLETARIAAALTRQTALNKPTSLAIQQFWGSVVRLGDYAVRMTLVPDSAALRETQGAREEDDDYLRVDLEARLRSGSIRYTLRLLYFTDEDRTPVNDASRSWDESPAQVDVADLILADGGDAKVVEAAIDGLPFNPGDGFEPLAITRARVEIYKASASGRQASAPQDYRQLFR
jgi:hypothetical protein